VPTADAQPQGITTGPDGLLYFAESNVAKIGRITPGSPAKLGENLTHLSGNPLGIAAGPNGVLYFANPTDFLGEVLLPSGLISVQFAGDGLGLVTSDAKSLQSFPGIECDGSQIGCIADFPAVKAVTLTASATPGSVFVGWDSPYPNIHPCAGTDSCKILPGDPAFQLGNNIIVTAVFRLTSSNEMVSVSKTGDGAGSVASSPSGISCGSTCNANFDRNAPIVLTATAAAASTFIGWSGGGCSGVVPCTVSTAAAATVSANFAANSSSNIALVSALLPTSRSVGVGGAATFFGTMINASKDTAGSNCTVMPATTIPGTFSFQTTDPATNAPVGAPNTPVTIAAGAAQNFVLSLTPSQSFLPIDVAFSFTCTNATPAASNSGLNTLLLSASTTPTPDVIALAATAGNDGIVNIPGVAGTGAFAVATANVGTAGIVTASADSGTGNLPISLTICPTDPRTAQCLVVPASQTRVSIDAGAIPTFSIFVKGVGNVPFQPAANRIFVKFKDAAGAIRGSTSVAVRTQ
jgi:hypothetical protein